MVRFKPAAHRSVPEIWRDVLKIIKSGECKTTRIMAFSNLDYPATMGVLDAMRVRGLVRVEVEGCHRLWFLTEAGEGALRRLSEILEVVG